LSEPWAVPRINTFAASAQRISRRVSADGRASTALSVGVISTYLTVIVVLPIAALVWESKRDGAHAFWQVVSSPEALGALKLTFGAAFVVVLINAVLGTITAWVLVRDDFRGKSLISSVIDLPFALPTIVAGLTLLTLYGPHSPVGIDIAFTRTAIVLALCFVTLPFVIRTVQPVLIELDMEMEEAARSLGAGQFTVFRRIVLPNILPGILSGSVLAFARALGEIGSIVLVAGSSLHTMVASVFIFNVIQDGDSAAASAVAIVLLGAAFVILLAVGAMRFYFTRHERA
jgi:sulfate/thiosulfate transport system permease protein